MHKPVMNPRNRERQNSGPVNNYKENQPLYLHVDNHRQCHCDGMQDDSMRRDN